MLSEDLMIRHICNEPLSSEERTVVEYFLKNDQDFRDEYLDVEVRLQTREFLTISLDKSEKSRFADKFHFRDESRSNLSEIIDEVLIYIKCENEAFSEYGQELFEKKLKYEKPFVKKYKEYDRLNNRINEVLKDRELVELKETLQEIGMQFNSRNISEFEENEENYCDIPNQDKEFLAETEANEILRRNKRVKLIKNWAVAATIALLIGLNIAGDFSISNFVSNGMIYNSFYEPYNVRILKRKGSNPLLIKGVETYLNENYQVSKNSFLQIANKEENKSIATFYLGLIHVELNQIKESINYFSEVAATNSNYSNDAKWYLALCYIKMGNINLAKQNLHELSQHYDTHDDFNNYKKRVNKLLKSLL